MLDYTALGEQCRIQPSKGAYPREVAERRSESKRQHTSEKKANARKALGDTTFLEFANVRHGDVSQKQ